MLLAVTEDDLERLDLREMRYRRTDVSADVEVTSGAGADVVVAYTARPENFAPEPPEDAILIASYVRAVEAAFDGSRASWRSSGRRRMRPRWTSSRRVLVEDEIPEGNPRDW